MEWIKFYCLRTEAPHWYVSFMVGNFKHLSKKLWNTILKAPKIWKNKDPRVSVLMRITSLNHLSISSFGCTSNPIKVVWGVVSHILCVSGESLHVWSFGLDRFHEAPWDMPSYYELSSCVCIPGCSYYVLSRAVHAILFSYKRNIKELYPSRNKLTLKSNTIHGLYSTESIKIQHHTWAIQYWVHQSPTPYMGYTVLSPSKSNTIHGLYSTESIKIQHHTWAIQYWVHQSATPYMGYTVLSPSKYNTIHGLYSTESIKIQHHTWAIQYWVHQNTTQSAVGVFVHWSFISTISQIT